MSPNYKTIFLASFMILLTLSLISIAIEKETAHIKQIHIPVNKGDLGAYVIEPYSGKINEYVIIMFHSYLLSKLSLKSLGIELSKLGLTVVDIDWPGHGSSDFPLDVSFYTGQLERMASSAINASFDLMQEAIEYVKKDIIGNEKAKIILVGHSIGGGLALLLGAFRDDVLATIALSPGGLVDENVRYFNATKPANVLALYGEWDEVHREDYIRYVFSHLGVSDVTKDREYGSIKNGTARLLKIIPMADHFSITINFDVMFCSLDWVKRVTGIQREVILTEPIRLLFILIAYLVGIIGIFTAPIALRDYIKIYSGGKRWPRPEISERAFKTAILWPILGFIFISIMIMVALIAIYIPMPFTLIIVIGYDIISFITSVILMIKLKFNDFSEFKSKLRSVILEVPQELLDDFNNVIYGILIGVLIIFVHEITLGQVYMSFVPQRFDQLVLAIIISAVLLPLLIPFDVLFRRYIQEAFGGNTSSAIRRTAILTFIARSGFLGLFMLLFSYLSGAIGLGIAFLLGLIIVMVGLEIMSAAVYYATREVVPVAIAYNLALIVFVFGFSTINNVHLAVVNLIFFTVVVRK